MSDQAAFTKAGANYPGYINARIDGENVIVTIREDADEEGNEGRTVSLKLAHVEWHGFRQSISNTEGL